MRTGYSPWWNGRRLCGWTAAAKRFWSSVKFVRKPTERILKCWCPEACRIRRTLGSHVKRLWATVGYGPAAQRVRSALFRPALATRTSHRGVRETVAAGLCIWPAISIRCEAEWVRSPRVWSSGAANSVGRWFRVRPTFTTGKWIGIWATIAARGHVRVWSTVTVG